MTSALQCIRRWHEQSLLLLDFLANQTEDHAAVVVLKVAEFFIANLL